MPTADDEAIEEPDHDADPDPSPAPSEPIAEPPGGERAALDWKSAYEALRSEIHEPGTGTTGLGEDTDRAIHRLRRERDQLDGAVQATRDLTHAHFDATPEGIVDAWRAVVDEVQLRVAELLPFARAGAEVNKQVNDLAVTLLRRIRAGAFGDGRLGECDTPGCDNWAVQILDGARCHTHRRRP